MVWLVILAALLVLILLMALVPEVAAAGKTFSEWLMLGLLTALGLWPITLVVGLIVLAVVSIWRGGWPWMREWLGSRLQALVIPALAVFTALAIGALVLFFTDQQVYEALREGGILEAIKVGVANLRSAYGALYEGALGSPAKILQAIPETIG